MNDAMTVRWGDDDYRLDTVEVHAVNVLDDDLSPLASLAQLEVLRVTWTNPHETAIRFPTDLEPLRGLRQLRVVVLPGWEIHDLEPLAPLARLEVLDVARTRIGDLGPLRGMENLEVLDVARTRVRDLDPLEGLPALRRVILDGCPVTTLRPLHGAHRLEYVSVRDTVLSDADVEALARAVPGVSVGQ